MEKSFKSVAANYGIILGIILSLITVFAYAVMLELYIKWWFGISMFILVIIFGTIAAVKSKKILGGYMSFKESFTAYFITVLIGTLISTIVGILIFNVIDPGAAKVLHEMVLDQNVQMMRNFGAPQATIDEAIAVASETNSYSAISQIQQYAVALVIFCVIGLIVALAVRRKDPNAVE